ncbi:MAG: glycosyltransferase family 2 protein [Oligoflexia bacterium]|nr:glycosyltransferase family 2 protein [Oligoflexia bacterium]
MINSKKIVVVLPAYKAEKTLEKTVKDIPEGFVDEIVLVDDYSQDKTIEIAKKMGLKTISHQQNLGYGGNQKTCYNTALNMGADIVIMLHPDYQYEPKLVPAMASMVASGVYDVVFGSRILGRGAVSGGMPLYKYFFNRFLTLFQNIMIGQKLSEYHTGYRAYSRKALESVNYNNNNDDFVFDNEIAVQFQMKNLRFGEISCPTKYFPEASSINFRRSVKYGLGVLSSSIKYRLHRVGICKFDLFKE